MRIGEVATVLPPTVTLQNGEPFPVGVLRPGLVAGEPVALLKQGSTWLALGAVDDAPETLRQAMAATTGTLVTSVAGEIAVPSNMWAVGGTNHESTFILPTGHLYQVTISGAILPSGSPGTCGIRVRKGAATITGTQLISFEKDYAGGGGIEVGHVGYFKNTSGATVSTKLSLTIARIAAINVALFGDVTRPMSVEVLDIGSVAAVPALAAIAPSV